MNKQKTKKAILFKDKSKATRLTTRLLLGICSRMDCGVKIRLAKKWIDNGLIPNCACGGGAFLVQTIDF